LAVSGEDAEQSAPEQHCSLTIEGYSRDCTYLQHVALDLTGVLLPQTAYVPVPRRPPACDDAARARVVVRGTSCALARTTQHLSASRVKQRTRTRSPFGGKGGGGVPVPLSARGVAITTSEGLHNIMIYTRISFIVIIISILSRIIKPYHLCLF
jgi:hypothetical protein